MAKSDRSSKTTKPPRTRSKTTKKSPAAGASGKPRAAKASAGPAASGAHPLLGKPAPTFRLPSSDGGEFALARGSDETVVLYFYPKADTPGCTVEACGFRDAIASYGRLRARVVGISPDPLAAVKKFADKFSLGFPLLADEDHAVCERYGVWVQKSMYGKTYWGAARSTFIVRKGRVAHVFEKVKPEGHDAEVLAWLKASPA